MTWVWDNDGEGDFVCWREKEPKKQGRVKDEAFEVYLPALKEAREDAIRVIVDALNKTKIRPLLEVPK